MHAARKARLARLGAGRDTAATEEVCERGRLRFYAVACRLVREAMLRAGVDPACAPALREREAEVAGFVDTPELQAADEAFRAAEQRQMPPAGEDPRERLIAKLDGIGQHYAETGTLPDFQWAPFTTLLGWATPPEP